MKYLTIAPITIVISLMILINIFNEENTQIVSKSVSLDNVINATSIMDNEAYTLLKTKCLICHDAGTSHETMIAPPMIRVKEHYLEEGITKDKFVQNIKNWVKNPTEDKIQMPGAVNKFNIMPKLPYTDKDIESIASYLYDNDLDGPSWWNSGSAKSCNHGSAKGCDHGSAKGCKH